MTTEYELATVVSHSPTLVERLFNVHTLKAIGVALAGFGYLKSADVQAVIDQSGGDVVTIAIGIGGYVLANVLRAS